MRRRLLEILACPDCGGELELAASEADTGPGDGEVRSGSLGCATCSVSYPIVSGIPRFVDPSHDTSFGLQWNAFRLEQLDSFTGRSLSSDRFWSETGWDPDWLEGRWVLDAGCGAGRFMEIAAESGAEAVGVDISSAVDAAASSLGERGNVHLVQADLYRLPFRPGAFDGCYSIGVLQHTPDPAEALRSLPPLLRPGGRLALTVYERRRWTPLYAKYLIRPLTRRLQPSILLRLLSLSMPVLFPLSELLFRVPVLGRLFRFVLPVASYIELPLSWRARYRWALMDTFDMLAPAHDHPQTESRLRSVLEDSGIANVVRTGGPGLSLSGDLDGMPSSRGGSQPVAS